MLPYLMCNTKEKKRAEFQKHVVRKSSIPRMSFLYLAVNNNHVACTILAGDLVSKVLLPSGFQ